MVRPKPDVERSVRGHPVQRILYPSLTPRSEFADGPFLESDKIIGRVVDSQWCSTTTHELLDVVRIGCVETTYLVTANQVGPKIAATEPAMRQQQLPDIRPFI